MAQFVVLPPLSVVAPVFSAATGCNLCTGAFWTEWQLIPDELLEILRPYIRPCHQTLLDRTLSGGNPVSLLRQILRPYLYRIETLAKGWRLVDLNQSTVAHVPGATVLWD
jgi:hypothetical protein